MKPMFTNADPTVPERAIACICVASRCTRSPGAEESDRILETLDSIEMLELISAIEREFKITLTDEELELELFQRFDLLVQTVNTALNRSNKGNC